MAFSAEKYQKGKKYRVPTKLSEDEKVLIKRKKIKAEQSILDAVISKIYSSEKE